MTLDEEIEWWRERADRAKSKELAMTCFGIATGLKLAKADYEAKQLGPQLRKRYDELIAKDLHNE